MENCSETHELLSIVGPLEILTRFGTKLQERWKDDKGTKRKEDINEYYAMGQNASLNSVPDVVDTLTILGYSRWQSWYFLSSRVTK